MKPEIFTLPDGHYLSLNAREFPVPDGCKEYETYDIQSAVKRHMAEFHFKPERVWFDEHKVYIPKDK